MNLCRQWLSRHLTKFQFLPRKRRCANRPASSKLLARPDQLVRVLRELHVWNHFFFSTRIHRSTTQCPSRFFNLWRWYKLCGHRLLRQRKTKSYSRCCRVEASLFGHFVFRAWWGFSSEQLPNVFHDFCKNKRKKIVADLREAMRTVVGLNVHFSLKPGSGGDMGQALQATILRNCGCTVSKAKVSGNGRTQKK